jgi:hypothetical protein
MRSSLYWAGIWPSGQSGGLARLRSRFETLQGRPLYMWMYMYYHINLLSIHQCDIRQKQTQNSNQNNSLIVDVYPQRREHSWDGYERYTQFLFHFVSMLDTILHVCT